MEIPQGNEIRPGRSVLLDPEDMDLLQDLWQIHPQGYVYRRVRGTTWWLHQVVAERMQPDANIGYVKFRNGARMDCRRANLVVRSRTAVDSAAPGGTDAEEDFWPRRAGRAVEPARSV